MNIKDVAESLGLTCDGDQVRKVSGVSSLDDPLKNHVLFIGEEKMDPKWIEGEGSFLVAEKWRKQCNDQADKKNKTYLFTKTPKKSFIALLKLFDPYKDQMSFVQKEPISKNAKISNKSRLGPFCIVSEGAEIHDNVILMGNNFIGRNVKIEKNTILHPGVTILADCSIGKNVIIHAQSVIGGDGFGYENNGKELEKIPQIGSVLVADHVEIGCGVTIDRATVGQTRIGENTKIDNLVQIGHNVKIGKNCILVSQVGIGGSSTLGDGVILAGQVGVADHVVIGDGCIATAKSGLRAGKTIPAGQIVGGIPAYEIKEHRRLVASIKKLPKIIDTINKSFNK